METDSDLLDLIEDLADQLWRESQANETIIRDAGIIQSIVLRIDAITGAPERS